MGRLLQTSDPAAAQAQFIEANRFFAILPDMALHRAYVGSQLAGFAVARGQGEAALALLAPHLDTAARHENAALLSTLMLLRAEARSVRARRRGADRPAGQSGLGTLRVRGGLGGARETA
jgi:hypothetical protein